MQKLSTFPRSHLVREQRGIECAVSHTARRILLLRYSNIPKDQLSPPGREGDGEGLLDAAIHGTLQKILYRVVMSWPRHISFLVRLPLTVLQLFRELGCLSGFSLDTCLFFLCSKFR